MGCAASTQNHPQPCQAIAHRFSAQLGCCAQPLLNHHCSGSSPSCADRPGKRDASWLAGRPTSPVVAQCSEIMLPAATGQATTATQVSNGMADSTQSPGCPTMHEPHVNSRALRSSAAHVTQAKDSLDGMPSLDRLRTCQKATEPAAYAVMLQAHKVHTRLFSARHRPFSAMHNGENTSQPHLSTTTLWSAG
jgi:hypothetical protein